MGGNPTPAASHPSQADLGGANLSTLCALGVGRKVALSVVVLSQNLGQSLPGIVGGALHTVWHSEFLVKTRQTTIFRDWKVGCQCNERGSNVIKKISWLSISSSSQQTIEVLVTESSLN